MVSHLFFYQLVLVGLVWLCLMLHWAWPSDRLAGDQKPSQPLPPPRMRSSDSKPFPGLTCKPPCAACEESAKFRGESLSGMMRCATLSA